MVTWVPLVFGRNENWGRGHISNCHLSALQMLRNNTQLYILNDVARLQSWQSGWWDHPVVTRYRGLIEGPHSATWQLKPETCSEIHIWWLGCANQVNKLLHRRIQVWRQTSGKFHCTLSSQKCIIYVFYSSNLFLASSFAHLHIFGKISLYLFIMAYFTSFSIIELLLYINLNILPCFNDTLLYFCYCIFYFPFRRQAHLSVLFSMFFSTAFCCWTKKG